MREERREKSDEREEEIEDRREERYERSEKQAKANTKLTGDLMILERNRRCIAKEKDRERENKREGARE